MPAPLNLGGGVTVTFVDRDGQRIGFDLDHPARGQDRDGPCRTWVPTEGEGAWTISREAPLSVSPTIKCEKCGFRCFISRGQWVAC